MADVELRVAGRVFVGWTSVRVVRSLEALAGTFEMGFTAATTPDSEPLPISEGVECSVSIGGQQVLRGYVDESETSYDATSHSLSVSGRSKASDLVDCSATAQPGQWKDQTLIQLASALCQPFGIGVTSETDTGGAIPRFTLQEGETVFEALDRAARMKGVLLTSDPAGGLVFTRAGKRSTSTALERGVNILAGARSGSWKDRHSTYLVKGQGGGPNLFGVDAAAMEASATDGGIARHRPLVILAEDQGSLDDLQKRATWERNVRAGRANRLSYSVQGWKHVDGVWGPNLLVRVRDPWLRCDEQLLVVTAALILDEQGTRTELELTKREAFEVLELPAEKAAEGWWQ